MDRKDQLNVCLVCILFLRRYGTMLIIRNMYQHIVLYCVACSFANNIYYVLFICMLCGSIQSYIYILVLVRSSRIQVSFEIILKPKVSLMYFSLNFLNSLMTRETNRAVDVLSSRGVCRTNFLSPRAFYYGTQLAAFAFAFAVQCIIVSNANTICSSS